MPQLEVVDSLLFPKTRFPDVTAPNQRVVFEYEARYMLGIGTAGRGTLSGEGGQITPSSGWYVKGSIVNLTASVRPGWMLAYWEVYTLAIANWHYFTPPTRQISVTIYGTTDVTATFVPLWHKIGSSGQQGHVTIHNLIQGQRMTLLDTSGKVISSQQQQLGPPDVSLDITIEITSSTTLEGTFLVTAPDGHTVVYTSQVISNITSGDEFEY